MKTLTRKTTKAKANTKVDWFFGRDTNFVCLFKLADRLISKPYDDLTAEEWAAASSGEWNHFVVYRNSKGKATVRHHSSSDIQNLGDFVLSAHQARGLTDAEIVAISQEQVIQPNNLLAQLKAEYLDKTTCKWSRKSLEDQFGLFAINKLLEQGYLVQSREGWVALAHTQPGTVANTLSRLGINDQRLNDLYTYFATINPVVQGA